MTPVYPKIVRGETRCRLARRVMPERYHLIRFRFAETYLILN